jgi:hypothetical protein
MPPAEGASAVSRPSASWAYDRVPALAWSPWAPNVTGKCAPPPCSYDEVPRAV